MANKQALFGGRVVKVDNKSGFDKSRLNLLTTGVGTITPIAKQLVIPNSDGRISTSIHAELPPLATNAYLRTHLKVEAFFCPLRLCYGGFESWFSGAEVYFRETDSFGRAELPMGLIPFSYTGVDLYRPADEDFKFFFGASSLSNYFNVNFGKDLAVPAGFPFDQYQTDVVQFDNVVGTGIYINIFPYIVYHLIYDHWYRNKSVTRPSFSRPGLTVDTNTINEFFDRKNIASVLPYIALGSKFAIAPDIEFENSTQLADLVGNHLSNVSADHLLNGQLFMTCQRNYGDDYFTAAKPNAQQGNPVVVDTSGGSFTISALRAQNALQEFAEVNNYATPDFVQACKARYGATLSNSVAQHPVLLGSADFPMFTKGVELNNNMNFNAEGSIGNYRNPFASDGLLGATAGRASANGQEFVCDFHADEPGYIMLMATLVPEANYSEGIAHDMTLFTKPGDLTDLPCSLLENIGDEPIMARELYPRSRDAVFGYVQRYLWHKCASPGNEVHGLFVPGQSLDAFAPYRPPFAAIPSISSNFLAIEKTALDSVAAVDSGISEYGVMLDCAIRMSISEPLSESALPSLADPAREHGRSVYLSNGGSKLA